MTMHHRKPRKATPTDLRAARQALFKAFLHTHKPPPDPVTVVQRFCWYLHNVPVRTILADLFPDLVPGDPYWTEWADRILSRDLGAVFGHLDEDHRARLVAAALRHYED